MEIKFKIPVLLPEGGGRKVYKPGVHNLDESVINHWFIQGLIASGAAVLEAPIPPGEIEPPVKIKKERGSSTEVKWNSLLKELQKEKDKDIRGS